MLCQKYWLLLAAIHFNCIPGLPGPFIILPYQLIGAIVGVPGGVGAVRNGADIAVIVVGVGIGNIVDLVAGKGLQGCDLIGVGSIGIIMVYQPAALVVRLPFGDAAELVVMEQRFDIAVFRVVDPVRTVVGIGGSAGLGADSFLSGCKVAVGIVGIRDRMAASTVVAVVPEAGQAAHFVITVPGPVPGGGV